MLSVDQGVTRPNGIAFSPDEKIMYVACSDPNVAVWYEYTLGFNLNAVKKEIFANVTNLVGKEKGLPDGLKVKSSGHIFATGPGGVLVFNPDGRHLGTIRTGEATSNCAFDDKEGYLYITADAYLMRIALKTSEN